MFPNSINLYYLLFVLGHRCEFPSVHVWAMCFRINVSLSSISLSRLSSLPLPITLLLDCLKLDWKSWCRTFKGFVFFPISTLETSIGSLCWESFFHVRVGLSWDQSICQNKCVLCVSLCRIRQHAYGPCPFSTRSVYILTVHLLCSKYGIILNGFHSSTSDVSVWTLLDEHSVNAINILT